MAKPKTVFVCSECGQEYSKWNGRCTACGSWNTIEEAEPAPVIGGKYSAPAAELKFSPIGDVDCNDEIRYGTGSSELDRVLGGGLVKGSLVLIGGDRASENPRCCSRYAASWAASTLYSTFPARNPNVR